jgi:hypothetical protein
VTSRRAPTECDNRLPLFGRGSTCRASDSSTPGRHARRQCGIRLVAWLDSCVATCRPDRVRFVRHTSHVWGVAQLVRLVDSSDSVGRRCHGRHDSSHMHRSRKSARLVDLSDSSIFCVTFGVLGLQVTAYTRRSVSAWQVRRVRRGSFQMCLGSSLEPLTPSPTQSATRLPSAHLTTRPLGLAAQEAWMQPEHWSEGGAATVG